MQVPFWPVLEVRDDALMEKSANQNNALDNTANKSISAMGGNKSQARSTFFLAYEN